MKSLSWIENKIQNNVPAKVASRSVDGLIIIKLNIKQYSRLVASAMGEYGNAAQTVPFLILLKDNNNFGWAYLDINRRVNELLSRYDVKAEVISGARNTLLLRKVNTIVATQNIDKVRKKFKLKLELMKRSIITSRATSLVFSRIDCYQVETESNPEYWSDIASFLFQQDRVKTVVFFQPKGKTMGVFSKYKDIPTLQIGGNMVTSKNYCGWFGNCDQERDDLVSDIEAQVRTARVNSVRSY